MPDAPARWLDRNAAAAYVSVRVHELPRLVREGKIPAPSLHLGPRSPTYDREALDAAFGKPPASSDLDEAIQKACRAIAKQGRPRRQASAR